MIQTCFSCGHHLYSDTEPAYKCINPKCQLYMKLFRLEISSDFRGKPMYQYILKY